MDKNAFHPSAGGLRERQEEQWKRLAEFVERDPSPVIEADRQGKVTYVNAAAKTAFPDLVERGAAHELLHDWPRLFQQLDREPARPLARLVAVRGLPHEEWIHLNPDRSRARVQVHEVAARERELEVVRRFEIILNRVPDLLTLIDREYVYLAANEAYCAAHRLKRDSLVGKTVAQVWGDQIFKTVIKGHLDRALEGEEVSYQLWVDFPNLGRRQVAVGYLPLRNPAGEVTLVVVVTRDVTRILELEAKLSSREQQEALGRLAQGVVQSLGRAVTAIQERLPALKDMMRGGRDDVSTLTGTPVGEVAAAVGRLHEVLDDLKAYSERSAQTIQTFAVPEVLAAAVKKAMPEIPAGCQVRQEPSRIPPVIGDPYRLQDVLVCLLTGAGRAIKSGRTKEGRITLEGWQQGNEVKISVADTGPAIAEALHAVVFEPFGADLGERSTLRLATCRRVVEEMGGKLELAGQAGVQFVITLPQAEARAAAASPKSRRANLVVIDDEQGVISRFRNLLGEVHEVTAFTSGREALNFLAKIPAVDIIFCDLMMPGMSGMEVHQELANRHPELARKVVFLTGGLTTPQAERFLLGVTNRRCGKPLDAVSLVQLVREALSR